uniref:protodermal factor 1 n=1 Tax=Erigeron canadensis TaxID=72917 RepID=UPI001CB8D9A6|nr:protodermal factor 1 [Erigeron canadensis]
MERSVIETRRSCLMLICVASLLSQNLVFCANSNNNNHDEDQKNIYLPPFFPSFGSPPPLVLTPPVDPSTPIVPSPPIGYYTSPPPSYGGTPPSHGSGGSTPPVHHTPTPSHGSGGGHHHAKTPPTNCGNPPKPRSPPKRSPVDPSPPPTYHYSPPIGGSTPLPPITPGVPFPSPPTDPNSPPIGGPCDFWRNHPTIIWGLFGWYGTTLGSAFGIGTLPGSGASLNLVQALSNTRSDGIGALYREGTASLLNSMVNKHFPYTTTHVKDSFLAAVGSNKAAAAQARVFKLANEGHMKLRV